MQRALELAGLAAKSGEVPIGAVVVRNGTVIGEGYNQVESLNDSTAHAEIIAIREASMLLKNWRLEGCSLYVTLEPCVMCIGALRLARISEIVCGAGESRFGSISRFRGPLEDATLGPTPKVLTGVLADRCSEVLKSFFREVRKK